MFKMSFKLSSMLLLVFSFILTSCSNNRSDTPQNPNENNTSTHEHTFSNSYEYDDNYHWHSSTCGHDVQSGKGKHSFISSITEPTYESGGYTTYTCSTCGYSYIDNETDALTHHYSNEWTYDSSAHWHACIDYGYENLRKDESNHTFTTLVTEPTYESGGYTTYTCSTCGYSYTDDETDALTHHYSNEWTYNSSTHWHACTDEGYEDLKKDEESHTFTTSVTDPTYESGGYTTYTCTTCGYTCTGDDTEPLPITITRKNYDGTILEVDNNVPYGSVPSYDGTTPTKESDDNNNYYFSGWTPKVEKATENATYTATFASEEITYTIDFDLNGGLSDSYKGPLEVKSFSKDFFFFDCVKDDWSFRGWEYQNEKIFDEKGNQLKNVTLVDNMVFKAIYSQTVKLTIATNMPEAGTITGEGEYPYNTYVDVSVKPNQGYKFVGWYYQNTLLSNEEVYKYMMWDEDITLEARFERDDFNLRIYTNNKDYGLVLLKSNSVIDDYLPEYADLKEYGSEVTIAAYSKSDVRFLGWYDENNNLVTTNAVYTFVMPNYDYALEAKWDYFTINYNLNGGVNNPNNPDYYTLSDDIINLESPTKEGYSFLGWKCNGEFVDKIDTSIANNITLEAVWSDYRYKIYNDDNDGKYASIISFNDSIIDVIIPESISFENQIIPVKKIDEDAFKNNSKIRSITIPISVISLGNNAFYNCSNLTTVSISENSRLTTIGDYAFYDCSSLTSIYIPSSATTIGSYAFRNCSNLTIYCEVPSEPSGWDSSWNYNERPVVWNSYKGIHDNLNGLEYVACYDEDGNPYITITGYNGSNTDVVILEYINVNGEDIIVNTIAEKAFYDNDTITSVTIPDSVTTIGSYAFRNCSNLTIYCEVPSKPSGWDSSWNYNKRPVVWNSYKGIHDNLNGLEYVACYDKDGNPYITITGYNGSNTDVVIPEYIEVNGEQIVIKEISNTAFRNNTVITSINIPDGVTSIGNRAFYGCSNLKTVAINSRLTTIGDSAFYNCYSLTSIYIPHSVTAIGSYAFYMCSNLTIYCEAPSEPSGWKSYWNHSHRPVLWSSYNGIYGNFSGFEYGVCIDEDGNKYITILGYNGSNTNVVIPEYIKVNGKDIIVKTIADNAFYNNFAITSVTISDSVTSIGDYAFYHCSSLTSINIPNSVTTIGSSAFDECSNLTTVRFGENSQLTTIGNSAFSHCSSLISINIPNSVTKIGDYAFSHCSSLISIYVPDNVTTIGDSAFYNCSKLTAVTIGEESQLTTIGVSAFSHCSSLISINIPNSVTKIGHYAFYNCSSLTSIYIPNSVTTIGSYAFSHCSSLTSIYIPDSVTTIGYYAFENCSNLTICCEVPFSPSGWDNYWNSSKRPIVWNCIDYGITAEGIHYGVLIDEDGNKYITITGYSGSYTNVVVSEYINVNGENIIVKTIADNAFYNNDTITSVTIPNSVTTIGSLAFYNCYSLTSIYISSSVTTIGSSAFDGCTNLTIYCQACSKPSGWADYWWNSSDRPVVWSSYLGIYGYFNDFEYGVCIDEDGNKYITITGYNASNTDVVIPESINVNGEDVIVKAIADNAFYNNDTITSVTISDCVTFIGDSAFYSCSSLISINIPNSVTKIGDYAFYNCSKLTSVTIGEESQLTTIGYAAFSDCSSLTSIYIPSSVTIIGSYAFDGCSNLTIYCQASSEPSGWSGLSWNYSNRPVVWETTYEEYLAEIA